MKRTFILFFMLCAVFSLNAQFTGVGDTQQMNNNPCGDTTKVCYKLTSDSAWQVGAVWNDDKIDLSNAFSMCFTMNFGNSDYGADGIAFVLHNDSQGTSAIGSGGGDMGYGGNAIAPSLAVEFDTYYNPSNDGIDDIRDDHISLVKNGQLNSPIKMVEAVDPASGLDMNIEDGGCHDVCVSWDPATQTLVVSFDGEERINTTIDLINDVMGGATTAYWGFTAATGMARNDQYVCVSKCVPCQTFYRHPSYVEYLNEHELKDLGEIGGECCFEYRPFFDLDPFNCDFYAYDIIVNGKTVADTSSGGDYVAGDHTHESLTDLRMTSYRPVYSFCFDKREFDPTGEIDLTIVYYDKCGQVLESRTMKLKTCESECCKDFSFLACSLIGENLFNCAGYADAVFTGDPKLCDDPYILIDGPAQIKKIRTIQNGVRAYFEIPPFMSTWLTAYLVSSSGDTLCEITALLSCPRYTSPCHSLTTEAMQSSVTASYDINVYQSTVIPVDVYGIRLNGSLVMSSSSMPITIPDVSSPGLNIGTVNPLQYPEAFVEFLDMEGKELCAQSLKLTPLNNTYGRLSGKSSSSDLKLVPNPANDVTTVHFELPESGEVQVSIVDYTGRTVVYTANHNLTEGTHELKIPTHTFANGVYMLTLTSDEIMLSQKLIIQR